MQEAKNVFFYGKHNHSTQMHCFLSKTEQYDVGTKRENLFYGKQNKYDYGAKQMHYFLGKTEQHDTNALIFIENRKIRRLD